MPEKRIVVGIGFLSDGAWTGHFGRVIVWDGPPHFHTIFTENRQKWCSTKKISFGYPEKRFCVRIEFFLALLSSFLKNKNSCSPLITKIALVFNLELLMLPRSRHAPSTSFPVPSHFSSADTYVCTTYAHNYPRGRLSDHFISRGYHLVESDVQRLSARWATCFVLRAVDHTVVLNGVYHAGELLLLI